MGERCTKNLKRTDFFLPISYHICRLLTSSDVALQLPPDITNVRIVSKIYRGAFFSNGIDSLSVLFTNTFLVSWSKTSKILKQKGKAEVLAEVVELTLWILSLFGAFLPPSFPLSSQCLTKIPCYPKCWRPAVLLLQFIPHVVFTYKLLHHEYA